MADMEHGTEAAMRRRRERWVSDCCSAEMTTQGGDGDYGSSCWSECRECGEPCSPVLVREGE
jgi:hypothetical protein